MPELEKATISGIEGKGYVEITTQDGVKRYNGVLEAEAEALTELGERPSPLEFEGVAADQMHTYRITLPIRITHFDTPTRAFFEGVKGPERLDPLDLEEFQE